MRGKYTNAYYERTGEYPDMEEFPDVRSARVAAKHALVVRPSYSRVVIRKYGAPFEVAHRVYNMKRNAERIVISKM